MLPMKAVNRWITAAGVQGDQEVIRLAFVTLREGDTVAQLAQNALPAQRGDSIPVTGMRARRRDHPNSHICPCDNEQVRNPAHTSRRSGL